MEMVTTLTNKNGQMSAPRQHTHTRSTHTLFLILILESRVRDHSSCVIRFDLDLDDQKLLNYRTWHFLLTRNDTVFEFQPITTTESGHALSFFIFIQPRDTEDDNIILCSKSPVKYDTYEPPAIGDATSVQHDDDDEATHNNAIVAFHYYQQQQHTQDDVVDNILLCYAAADGVCARRSVSMGRHTTYAQYPFSVHLIVIVIVIIALGAQFLPAIRRATHCRPRRTLGRTSRT